MFKIFKYELDPITRSALMPRCIPLRVDHVDDGFYKGDFVWAIVDENEGLKHNQYFHEKSWSASPEPNTIELYTRQELLVKEKQQIHIRGVPIYADNGDGKMFVYYDHRGPSAEIETHTIAVYKTGQPIDIPIEKLTYLGLNRLWIIQELGLYTFLVNE